MSRHRSASSGELESVRAAAWVSHLREGGSTTWADFHGAETGQARTPGPIPGAQQLELLRRVNRAGSPSPNLIEEVLRADLPMRGPLDLGLAGVEAGGVDPSTLPERELVRVAAGVLARRALSDDVADPPPSLLRRASRWLARQRVRPVGDPVLVRAFGDQVAPPPLVPGRRRRVVVIGTALDQMLVHAWWQRVLRRGAPSWERWQRGVLARDRLPRTIDLPRIARAWGERRTAVEVALDPPSAAPPPLDPAVAELSRRVGAVLSVSVDAPRRTRLLRRRVVPALAALADQPRTHQLGEQMHAWAWVEQERLHHRLRVDGYPVTGEVKPFAPPADPPGELGMRRTSGGSLLGLAVAALLDEGTPPRHARSGGGS